MEQKDVILKMSSDLLDLINQTGTPQQKLERCIFYIEQVVKNLK